MSDLLKLENQICHRFYTLSNAFTRAYRPLLRELDITYPQYIVMMALWEDDGVAISEIVRKTMMDAGALTLILQKLADKTLIELRKDEQDKRAKRVWLTSKGHAQKAIAETVPAQMLCKLDGMSREEGRELMRLLDKLKGCFNMTPEDDL